MRELGADGPSYETIVATGPRNAPLPHHRPDGTALEDGHTVIIDVGALVDGYHSDMTRTYVIGDADVAAAGGLRRGARRAARRGGGRRGRGSRRASSTRSAVTRSPQPGTARGSSHGTGHGVGLLIHEDPFVNATGDAVLAGRGRGDRGAWRLS